MSPTPDTQIRAWREQLAEQRPRLTEVRSETEAAIHRLALADAPDAATLGAARAALRERHKAIEARIDHGQAALTQAFAAAVAEASTRGDAAGARRLRFQLAEERRQSEPLRATLRQDGLLLDASLRAADARALFRLAQKEWRTPRPCLKCGARIAVGALSAPTAFACGSCGAVQTERPGPASARYFGGEAIDGLATEASADAWVALDDAEFAFRRLREPLAADTDLLTSAARKAAEAWGAAARPLHPAWDDAAVAALVHQKVEAVVSPLTARAGWRAAVGAGLQAAAAGRTAELLALADQERVDPAAFVEAICVSLHEHGNRDAAWQALAVLHHVRREKAERNQWMLDRIMELDDDLRTR